MMRKTLNVLLISLCLVQTRCYYDRNVPSDQNVWPVAHPSTQLMDSRMLTQMDSVLRAHPNEGITSMVIIKGGNLVFENYYFGHDRTTLSDLGGVSSSLANLALGKAIELGLIASVEDPIYNYLPSFAQVFEDSPLKKDITFEHLMTMKSGLSWNEFAGGFDGQENDIDKIIQSENWVEYLITRPIDVLPGRRFSYNSAIPVLIAAAIENQYGDNYQSYLLNEVFKPLDIENVEIAEVGTNLNTAWGVSMTTLDLAKVGYLYLQKGNWFEEQVLSEDYAVASVNTQTSVDFYNNFGWLWWRYSDGDGFLSFLSQNDTFFAAGNGDQRLYVVPHLDLVVAITGKDERLDFSLSAPLIFKDYILSSIQ